jgi:hypothetical protein
VTRLRADGIAIDARHEMADDDKVACLRALIRSRRIRVVVAVRIPGSPTVCSKD